MSDSLPFSTLKAHLEFVEQAVREARSYIELAEAQQVLSSRIQSLAEAKQEIAAALREILKTAELLNAMGKL
jgi:hypothetical protein